MEEKFLSAFSDNSTLVSHCPVCNLRYDPLNLHILDENERAHIVHVSCRYCHSAIIAVIIASSLGISSIGLITDLSADDAIRFRQSATISSDDVIEAYQFLHRDRVLIDHFE